MVKKWRSEYQIGMLAGTIWTGIGGLALMGFLGAWGSAYYIDQKNLIEKQEEKIGELEKKVNEKKCPPCNKLPWCIPFLEQYRQVRPYQQK